MNNRFQQLILEQVVKPALDQVAKTSLGTVLEYDKVSNTATINATDPNTGQEAVQFFVPVQIANGFNQCGPFPGQRVVLSFTRGEFNSPVITGVCDQRYDAATREFFQTHRQKGGFLPDAICAR